MFCQNYLYKNAISTNRAREPVLILNLGYTDPNTSLNGVKETAKSHNIKMD